MQAEGKNSSTTRRGSTYAFGQITFNSGAFSDDLTIDSQKLVLNWKYIALDTDVALEQFTV